MLSDKFYLTNPLLSCKYEVRIYTYNDVSL